jgi:hypothetical protein
VQASGTVPRSIPLAFAAISSAVSASLLVDLVERVVLVLGEERRLPDVEPEVHRVLDRAQLVGVVPHRPGDDGPLVHRLAVGR